MRAVLPALLLLLGTASSAAAEDPAPFTPAFPATEAEVMHVTDAWILWARSDRIPTGQRAEPRHWRWWIQSVATGKTRLFLEYRGRWSLEPVSVQPDGTILLAHLGTLLWYHPDDDRAGDPRKHPRRDDPHPRTLGIKTDDARRFQFPRGTERGVVAQPYRTMSHQVAWWVPFNGRALDWKARKRMTDLRGTYVNHPITYLPAGHEIAWHGFIFDTKTGRGRGLPGGVRGHVRAFDGRWAADFRAIASMKDGTRRKLPHNHQVFTIRDGRAYAIQPTGGPEPTRLLAIDCKDGRITGLHALATPRMRGSLHYQDRTNTLRIHRMAGGPYTVFWNRLGIHHWVDDRWRFQPWLPPKP